MLEICELSKSYGGVPALADVSLTVRRGEVHAVCGENGAGKSTLIKILAGVVRPDHGRLRIEGRDAAIADVAASEAAGIAVMHQESTAFPDLNAVDNLFVGRELTRAGGCLLDRVAMERRTRELLGRLSVQVDIHRPLAELPLAQRQLVALARALLLNCRLLIMDEPTASLSARETDVLMRIVQQLRAEGVSVLYVSHRLEEIFALADRVTVLRDGHYVDTTPIDAVTTEKLIQKMVGRELSTVQRQADVEADEAEMRSVVLQVNSLSRRDYFSDINLSVREGEIVGLAGLVGAGRSEVARAIFGIDAYDTGQVRVNGALLPKGSVAAAMQAGVALVPEDRQHEGLVLPMSVRRNLTLSVLESLTRWGLIQRRPETNLVNELIRDLQVKTASVDSAAAALSGGNQQKLVIGKWLARQPKVLLLDEPTRGVDVGAKAQVHQLVRKLARDGIAALVISSELPELLALCDRIVVLRTGRIVGELPGPQARQEEILQMALPDGRPLVKGKGSA
ncbi:MAG: sugar ABC transporter ATP-binding protein [Planctomycetales bacterium]|nr:sugar ABC transporter ATP-binding protein [Planctomycetales bacterium]